MGSFLRIGGGKDEFDVLGRLFQCFQHGVECCLGKHVHFVNDVDLETADGRCVLRVIQHFAHVVDAGIGRCVQLQQVDKAPGVDLRAGGAYTARGGGNAGLAIERLGQNPRYRGLADTARTGKQVRMMQTILRQRIAQRTHYMRCPASSAKVLGRHLRANT
jgi:hypothetical protein